MTLLGSDPFVTAEQAALRGVELVTIDDAARAIRRRHRPRAADRARPRRSSTRRPIARMKPGAFVLNVARGGIVDERGARGGAARGPSRRRRDRRLRDASRPTGSPLSTRPNTVLTPHLGASTAEAQVAVAEEIAEQVLDVLDGRPARYAVNAPLLSAEAEQTIGPYLPLAETLGRFLCPVRPGRRRDADRRARRRARRDRIRRRSPPPRCAACSRPATTERVNLVNAALLAKARGITVVERKTADAGGVQRRRSRCPGTGRRRGTVAVGGTLAGGELRLVRLNDYRLDMAAEDLCSSPATTTGRARSAGSASCSARPT